MGWVGLGGGGGGDPKATPSNPCPADGSIPFTGCSSFLCASLGIWLHYWRLCGACDINILSCIDLVAHCLYYEDIEDQRVCYAYVDCVVAVVDGLRNGECGFYLLV